MGQKLQEKVLKTKVANAMRNGQVSNLICAQANKFRNDRAHV